MMGGFKSGEYVASSGAGNYVGGTPAQLLTGGTVDALSGATPDDFFDVSGPGTALTMSVTGQSHYIGVFINCKAVDQLPGYDAVWSGSGSGKTFSSYYRVSVITGPAQLRLQSGTKNGVADGYPYITTDSWVPGDQLYVSSAGTWTNIPPTTGATSRGLVLAVGTTHLDVSLK